jgi:hypothetical protein
MQLSLVEVPPTTPVEVVYYATEGCLIKIGRTSSPRRRGGELKVDMLLTIPGGDFEERRHHRMWAKYRIGKSEWFRPGDELLLWLATRLLGNGPSREAAILGHMILGLKRRAAA